MSASIWNPGTSLQTATGNGTISEVVHLTQGQTAVPITLYNYTIVAKSLFVYINGVLQIVSYDYVETSTTSITLTNPATAGDICELVGVINLVNVVTNVYDSAEIDITSAATVNIGVARSNFIRITGTSTINSFGTSFRGPLFIRFAGELTIVASASMIMPDAANLITFAGMNIIVTPKASAGVADGWIITVR